MKAVKVAVSTAMHDVSAAPRGVLAALRGVSATPSLTPPPKVIIITFFKIFFEAFPKFK